MTQFKSIIIIDEYDHLPKWIGTEYFFEKHNSLRKPIIEKLEENAKLKLQIAELQEKLSKSDYRVNFLSNIVKDKENKLHRRNRQIADLKKKQNKIFNDCIAYNGYLTEKDLSDDFAEWFLNR